jgi:hypothetical protein
MPTEMARPVEVDPGIASGSTSGSVHQRQRPGNALRSCISVDIANGGTSLMPLHDSSEAAGAPFGSRAVIADRFPKMDRRPVSESARGRHSPHIAVGIGHKLACWVREKMRDVRLRIGSAGQTIMTEQSNYWNSHLGKIALALLAVALVGDLGHLRIHPREATQCGRSCSRTRSDRPGDP